MVSIEGEADLGRARRLVTLLPIDGREPPASLSDAEALAALEALSAPWHPAVLAHLEELPAIEPLEDPSPQGEGVQKIVPQGVLARLDEGHRLNAEAVGLPVVEAPAGRLALAEALLGRVGGAESGLSKEPDALVRDFLALGTARWLLRDLTIAMGHVDCLDHESLKREVLAGARAWREGDHATAKNRLRAAFELLTQARERFYPTDAYVVDLCLLNATTPVGSMTEALESRVPFSVMATAEAIEAYAAHDPEAVEALARAVDEGWADVIGGAYAESDEALMPVESILWQYRHGAEVYRRFLSDRTVETYARRRFGLYPMLPQVARRFAIRFGLHLALDDGRFPQMPEAKRMWESPDGTALEVMARVPGPADRESEGPRLPWRLARSMKEDSLAILPLVHWPSPVSAWYEDLRRLAAYSPVFGRWVMTGDYFHLTDRPWDVIRNGLDEYQTPYLVQGVRRGEDKPISGRAEHARRRARLDSAGALDAVDRSLRAGKTENVLAALEERVEKGLEADDEIEQRLKGAAESLSQVVMAEAEGDRAGYLVFNPLGLARRVPVLLPEAALDLKPEGPLRAAQFTDEGVWGVVEVAAMGFAWVPGSSQPEAPAGSSAIHAAEGRMIANEYVEIEVDPATGGLRSVRGPGEPTPRLALQIVANGLKTPDGQPATCSMQSDSVEVEYAGPALGQVVSRGRLVDGKGRTLARFRLQARLWSGCPTLRLNLALDDLDRAFLHGLETGDPWVNNLAVRWAWADAQATLKRTSLLGAEGTSAGRPETPDAIEIMARHQKTTLLFGGLAHHQKQGSRMLDTILLAGKESARSFEMGIVLDLENAFSAAMDLTGPAPVVAVEKGPPRMGPTGWFFHLDHPNVAITRIDHLEETADQKGRALVFHLLETGGRSSRCRLRLYRDPSWARQTDFLGDLIVDLPVEGDAVHVDLTPRELARVEVFFG